LRDVANASEPDPHFGTRMEFVNPATAGSVMPTMSAFSQLVPAGFSTKPVQSTDGGVFTVCEGAGQAKIDDEIFDLSPREVFVVPAWAKFSLTAQDDLMLFNFSDKAAQEKLNLWRQKKH
jgi:gentisate 1,2-dioxygenase